MELPVLFIHELLPQGTVDDSGQRAALGDGCSARDVVLSFLSFKPDLLSLRTASKACKVRVAEADLRAQIAAKQVPVITSRKLLDAMHKTFPNIDSAAINGIWTSDDMRAMARFKSVEMFPFDSAEDDSETLPLHRVPVGLLPKLSSGSFRLFDPGFSERLQTVFTAMTKCKSLSLEFLETMSDFTLPLPTNVKRLNGRGVQVDQLLEDMSASAEALRQAAPSGVGLEQLAVWHTAKSVSRAICFVGLTTLELHFDLPTLLDFSSLPRTLVHLVLTGCNLPLSSSTPEAMEEQQSSVAVDREKALTLHKLGPVAEDALLGWYSDFRHLPRLQSVSLVDCHGLHVGSVFAAPLPPRLTHVTISFMGLKPAHFAVNTDPEEGHDPWGAARDFFDRHAYEFYFEVDDLLAFSGSAVTHLTLPCGPVPEARWPERQPDSELQLKKEHLHALRGLQHLCVPYGWSVSPDTPDAYSGWTALKSLKLPIAALAYEQAMCGLPALQELVLVETPGMYKLGSWPVLYLHSLVLLKRSLTRLSFWADECDAHAVAKVVYKALAGAHKTAPPCAPLRIWWAPYSPRLSVPLHRLPGLDEARGDRLSSGSVQGLNAGAAGQAQSAASSGSDKTRWYVLDAVRLQTNTLFSCFNEGSTVAWGLHMEGRTQ